MPSFVILMVISSYFEQTAQLPVIRDVICDVIVVRNVWSLKHIHQELWLFNYKSISKHVPKLISWIKFMLAMMTSNKLSLFSH